MILFPPEPIYTDLTTAEFLSEQALATKYGRQGPRYTSYPTAPKFRPDVPGEYYYDWLRDSSKKSTAPLSLYIHIPFYEDVFYDRGSNKIINRQDTAAPDYLHHLKAEITMQSALIGSNRPIIQMHWGGRTPHYFDNAQITELMHMLASHFRLMDKSYREYSIEIDPGTIDEDTVALLKGLGFNRIRLGIQDFDALVQKKINRVQPYALVKPLVDCIRNHNFRSLSFDLIYGLPYQDRHAMDETLAKVIELRPDRIACYNSSHLPQWFNSQRAIDRHNLPTAEEQLLLRYLISRQLQEAGYVHLGMDHYVLPGDELAIAQREGRLQCNFQGYSLHMAEDLLGLGPSAISQMGDFYVQNERDLATYYTLIEQGRVPATLGCRVSIEDKLRRHIIMTLICELQLDIAECNRRFGIDFATRFAHQISLMRSMATDDLLQISTGEIRITARGRPFLRNICMLFDAYLKPDCDNPQVTEFSATI